ncbi:MAG: spore coat protein u, partial [Comamonadaceae bacterium]
GNDYIAYGIYKSTGTSDPWNAATPLTGTGNGSNQALSIYGNLASGASNAPAGTYLDTVTATVTY